MQLVADIRSGVTGRRVPPHRAPSTAKPLRALRTNPSATSSSSRRTRCRSRVTRRQVHTDAAGSQPLRSVRVRSGPSDAPPSRPPASIRAAAALETRKIATTGARFGACARPPRGVRNSAGRRPGDQQTPVVPVALPQVGLLLDAPEPFEPAALGPRRGSAARVPAEKLTTAPRWESTGAYQPEAIALDPGLALLRAERDDRRSLRRCG